MPYDVFISYSHEDQTVADKVCTTLENEKIRCWISSRNIQQGIYFPGAIIEAIDSSRVMVLVFSSKSNDSQDVLREINRAATKKILIIPFRIEDVAPSKDMAYYLGIPQWFDASTPPLEQHLQKLPDTVQALIMKATNETPGEKLATKGRAKHKIVATDKEIAKKTRKRSVTFKEDTLSKLINNDIRYVCLSDLHMGEEDSLMTNLYLGSSNIDHTKASPVMVQMAKCLEHLISQNEDKTKKPTLILNGDILELALANTNEANMVFERFIELIMPEGEEPLFDKRIIVLPGDHDHHLWETAREIQYVDYLKKAIPGHDHYIPWNTSRMFWRNDEEINFGPDAYLLTGLFQRFKHLKNVTVNAAYPNYGLLSQDGRKCVIFHHGHFTVPAFQLISTFKTLMFPDRELPKQVWEIEAENYAWIELFWSVMGTSRMFGQDTECLYKTMRNPLEFKRAFSNLATNLARSVKTSLPDVIEAKVLNILFSNMADGISNIERHQTGVVLTMSGKEKLREYIEGPLREQILTERDLNIPSDVTFVFGHTHKPFQTSMDFMHYPRGVNIYNTGGWIVDTVQPEPNHGGSIILVDEALNVVSLNMYHEDSGLAEYSVKLDPYPSHGEKPNDFFKRMLGLVHGSEDPWKTFSSTVASEVRARAENLQRG